MNESGHITKMAAMPIYGKNLLQNPKSDDLQTLHETLMAGALQTMYKL